ncbi:MAG: ABC transporter permease, partial [Eubacteriales bacterium]
ESYVAGLSEEERDGYITKVLTASLTEQYAEGVRAKLSSMTAGQLAASFDASEYTSSELAFLYDTFMPKTLSDSTYEENLRKLGYVDRENPSSINIFARTFEDKDRIADLIADYNKEASEEDQISYTDYVAILMSSVTTIISAISYVLIAFVAISLVVSSIMIGIITYISVLERTKEIGILRAIGASKRDISRVFNAETLTVGFISGAIGIGITLVLILIVNIILHALTGIPNLNAVLPWQGGVLLVLISMLLTFIAGLIPSGIAARKDPVVALRTE